MQAEKKVIKSRSTILEGSAGTLKNLTKTQEATGRAHLVIQGGNSTVDPNVISKLATTMLQKKADKEKKK
jgi:hypothetical protein